MNTFCIVRSVAFFFYVKTAFTNESFRYLHVFFSFGLGIFFLLFIMRFPNAVDHPFLSTISIMIRMIWIATIIILITTYRMLSTSTKANSFKLPWIQSKSWTVVKPIIIICISIVCKSTSLIGLFVRFFCSSHCSSSDYLVCNSKKKKEKKSLWFHFNCAVYKAHAQWFLHLVFGFALNFTLFENNHSLTHTHTLTNDFNTIVSSFALSSFSSSPSFSRFAGLINWISIWIDRK